MKKILFFIGMGLFIASCSQIESEEELPVWESLTVENMSTQLPIVHIEADQEELDELTENYHYKVIVDAQVKMINPQKESILDQEAQLQIRGVGSAAQPMKPFGMEFHSVIDNNTAGIIHPTHMAPGDDLSTIRSFRVRNSSQDYGLTMLKDLAYTELAIRAGFDLEVKYGRPVHVFVNSDYYGLHNLRTEVDQKALGLMLNRDTNDITTIKMDNANHNLEYREGNQDLAEYFIKGIKERNLGVIEEFLDIENFMDYIIFEDYIGNSDWPHNNGRAYHLKGGKFRFILFDLDMAARRTNNPTLPEMEFEDDHISRIYQTLLDQDPEFESRFHERQKYWYAKLSPGLFSEIVDELAADIEDEIPYLIARRGVPENTIEWRVNLEQMKRQQERTDRNLRKKYRIN